MQQNNKTCQQNPSSEAKLGKHWPTKTLHIWLLRGFPQVFTIVWMAAIKATETNVKSH